MREYQRNAMVQVVAEAIDPGAWSVNIPISKRRAASLRQARRAINALCTELLRKTGDLRPEIYGLQADTMGGDAE